MDLLLDTHIAIGARGDSPRLPQRARELISKPAHRILVSDISAWEIALKHVARPERMHLRAGQFYEQCRRAGYVSLALTPVALDAFEELDVSKAGEKHKDPFDRMLIAQAKTADALLLTHDRGLLLYGEPLVSVV